MDPGCDLKRDIDIMAYVGASKAEMTARACQKPELAKVMAACKALAATAEATQDPYIAMRTKQ